MFDVMVRFGLRVFENGKTEFIVEFSSNDLDSETNALLEKIRALSRELSELEWEKAEETTNIMRQYEGLGKEVVAIHSNGVVVRKGLLRKREIKIYDERLAKINEKYAEKETKLRREIEKLRDEIVAKLLERVRELSFPPPK